MATHPWIAEQIAAAAPPIDTGVSYGRLLPQQERHGALNGPLKGTRGPRIEPSLKRFDEGRVLWSVEEFRAPVINPLGGWIDQYSVLRSK